MAAPSYMIKPGTGLIVGIPHRGLQFTEFTLNFHQMTFPQHATVVSSHLPIDMARNAIAENVFTLGADWLFFMDDDTLAPLDAVPRLIARNLPIVSGLYHMKSAQEGEHWPCMMKRVPSPADPEQTLLQSIRDWTPGSLIDVDAVGAGCLLIHRRVLEAHPAFESTHRPRPWFEWSFGREAPLYCETCGKELFQTKRDMHRIYYICKECGFRKDIEGLSEDFQFCEEVIKKGFKIYVDSSIICKHMTIAHVNEKGRLEVSKVP